MQSSYRFMMFSHWGKESYIQKSVIFPSRSSYAINIYIHSSIYIYAIYIYKIRLLFIFIVTFLDSIKTALGSRQIFLMLTIIMTSLEVTLSFEMHIKLICILYFMSSKKSSAFPNISVNSQECVFSQSLLISISCSL